MTEVAATPARGWPRRFTLVGLCFAGIFICYIDRVNISIAIIPMAAELQWDRATQGLVLSSFFFGYLITQIVGGRLADRFGGKVVLGSGVLLWSLFTFITPWAAFGGLAALLVARVGMGIGEGVTFPSIYSLYARWIPAKERARAIGLSNSAIPLGTVFALLVTPWIVLEFGWPWAFYAFGLVGVVWYVFWHMLVVSAPENHSSLPAAERELIRREAAVSDINTPPPWRVILRTPAVWAIVVCHFCNNWGGYVLLSWLPTYVAEGLGVDFAAIGLFTMIPALVSFLFLNVAGWVADRLLARGLSVTRTRKWMQSIGFGGSAAVLSVVGYVESAPAAIALMTLGSAIGAFVVGGFVVNHLDIAPRHAGVLMGLSNTAGTLPGVVGVYVSGLILAATGSWSLVFQVAAGVYLFGLLFYLAFARGERLID